ncbi:MAG: hypothetical protein AAB942_00260 [Patescibacteria group bacterium]
MAMGAGEIGVMIRAINSQDIIATKTFYQSKLAMGAFLVDKFSINQKRYINMAIRAECIFILAVRALLNNFS